MKKAFLAVVLVVIITGGSLFAWEPTDLMEYPPCMEAGDWILNLGVGFHGLPSNLGGDYIWIPPFHFSLDVNTPLGDNKLPFFFGGSFGYWGHGYKHKDSKHSWYYSAITPGFRFGYHFNWDVEKLDTYAVTKLGWTLYTGDKDYHPHKLGFPSVGINLGARFFPISWFGFWLEAGFGSYYSVDIGIAFKF